MASVTNTLALGTNPTMADNQHEPVFTDARATGSAGLDLNRNGRTGRVKAPAPDIKRASKAVAAYRTISEVAAELGVATHVLRFWEGKFTVIKPLKKSGGRRYYKPEDIALLRHIQDLLYNQGYTILAVQAHLAKTKMRDLQ